jgi:hypothetical protein
MVGGRIDQATGARASAFVPQNLAPPLPAGLFLCRVGCHPRLVIPDPRGLAVRRRRICESESEGDVHARFPSGMPDCLTAGSSCGAGLTASLQHRWTPIQISNG